ncbi:DUF3302 domain-containing protein [Ruegeria sp. 2205SS24-7]|uniref:DUF3302 domain-containing protein n=1 Tax=Ruegeria discodermiae TaxID=3064389 RepID=UPI002740C95C|nr:DUF3302 domain-containing protein [Ruegeria sp. 2205SS24-7]MDP5216433.1 DUF3302 domain-containing protein [Ruegeria sp. 2205SS24-7]
MGLLGAPLERYDYLTFLALILILAAVMGLFLFLMGLPGRIAIKRNHPHAEAVKIMGWMGFLAVVPWVHAFMWAFHDGVTVDLRRMPEDERKNIRDEIKRLGGDVKEEYREASDDGTPSDDNAKS